MGGVQRTARDPRRVARMTTVLLAAVMVALLASGAAVCGVLGIWAITANSAIWEVLILGFAALPVSIGIGILKYRLYEIDRIISRTLAYAIVTGLLVGLYAGLLRAAGRVIVTGM